MDLKGLKKLGHDVPTIWREFGSSQRSTGSVVSGNSFDGVIEELMDKIFTVGGKQPEIGGCAPQSNRARAV